MNANGRTVLVVEDEPLIRFALCDLLLDHGYNVFEAGDALSAIAVFGSVNRIDAVISDVDMPGSLNGLDLVRLVARTSANITLIVTSGRLYGDNIQLPEGAHFVAKPFDEREILMLLARDNSHPADLMAQRFRA